jgi:hypothetical protein
MKLFGWFEWVAFAASALILLYVAYGLGAFLSSLGRWPRWNSAMKLLRWFEWAAFAASALILLFVAYGVGTFIYVFWPRLINPCEIAHGHSAKNERDDLAEYQVRDCAIIGSAAEERIGLKLADARDFVALVYCGPGPKTTVPVFSWQDEDHLSVDLGEVDWLTPQIRQLGHVTISYAYSGAEPSLE